jgi:hypothetical protein
MNRPHMDAGRISYCKLFPNSVHIRGDILKGTRTSLVRYIADAAWKISLQISSVSDSADAVPVLWETMPEL